MTEAIDNTVGVPYLHPRHIPRQAASIFSFLAPHARSLLFPRVYAASMGLEYMQVGEFASTTPFPDVDFDAQPFFIVVGYRGVLCGRKVESCKVPGCTTDDETTVSCYDDTTMIRNVDGALWDPTMLPFYDDNTLHPAFGYLFSIFTVEDDPSWFLFVNQERQHEQDERVLTVRVVRFPVVIEALRLYRAVVALVSHHLGAPAVQEVCHTLASLKELFATAREYSRCDYIAKKGNKCRKTVDGRSHFTPEEYNHLAEKMVSKQLVTVLNTVVSVKTNTHFSTGKSSSNDWPVSRTEELEVANQVRDGTDDAATSLPSPLQRTIANLYEELEQKRAWLVQEQEKRLTLTEAKKREEELRCSMVKELEAFRAKHMEAIREGNRLMVYLAEEERRRNKLVTAKREERCKEKECLDVLKSEYNKRLDERVQELQELRTAKSVAVAEKAARATARDGALRAVQAEKDALARGVQMLDEQLEKLKQKRTKSLVKCSSKKEVLFGCSNDDVLQEARAQNVALQRVLQKLTSEVRLEEKKENDLIYDVRAFNVDIDELEKRKILLQVEYSMLADTTVAMQINLRREKDALRAEEEAMTAERQQMPRRLMLQQERTRNSRLMKEETASLLLRLKSNIVM